MRAAATGLILLFSLATAGAADERAAQRERLFAALAASETAAESYRVADEIWRMWFTPPGEEVALMVDLASHLRIIGDFKASLEVWDRVVAIAPDWPEGWNQRATLHYRMGDYDASLADIEQVLKREPKHFGALAGRAEIEASQGRSEDAAETLRQAVAIHPFIAELELIDKGPGIDL